jgi:site-specific recombinase XerD
MGTSDEWSKDISKNWNLPARRFLSEEDVRALRECAFKRVVSRRWRKRSAVHEWLVLEIALESGLRVSEIAALTCGDFEFAKTGGRLIVRRGKGGKRRAVWIGKGLVESARSYLAWKERQREPVSPEAPALLSKATGRAYTARALQKMFGRVAKQAGVQGHTFHHLRHTYATYLYRASGNNLRLVQKQLGHSSIRTTEVYADVLDVETERAVNSLYSDHK